MRRATALAAGTNCRELTRPNNAVQNAATRLRLRLCLCLCMLFVSRRYAVCISCISGIVVGVKSFARRDSCLSWLVVTVRCCKPGAGLNSTYPVSAILHRGSVQLRTELGRHPTIIISFFTAHWPVMTSIIRPLTPHATSGGATRHVSGHSLVYPGDQASHQRAGQGKRPPLLHPRVHQVHST